MTRSTIVRHQIDRIIRKTTVVASPNMFINILQSFMKVYNFVAKFTKNTGSNDHLKGGERGGSGDDD